MYVCIDDIVVITVVILLFICTLRLLFQHICMCI